MRKVLPRPIRLSIETRPPLGDVFDDRKTEAGAAQVATARLVDAGEALEDGTLELSGWDVRVRPRRVAHLLEGARSAVSLPADVPGARSGAAPGR
jgi:hypothetical protein